MNADQLFLALMLCFAAFVSSQRFCYECSGFQCMQNPHDPAIFPGRVKCHEVMEYCTTHVRYEPLGNASAATSKTRLLTERDYVPTSASRSCAKVWLGNTCRRDWLGQPLITCITTCDKDFCNCDTRSPPPDMFRDGKVLHLAPKTARYSVLDTVSCGQTLRDRTRKKSLRIDDDYLYYNDVELRRRFVERRKKKKRLRKGRMRNQCTAVTPFVSLSQLVFFGSIAALARQMASWL